MRHILLFALCLSLPVVAQEEMPPMQAAVPMPTPSVQLFDQKGKPLAGGKVYTYAAGTSTPLATYTDSTAGTPNANPVILDGSGRGAIWVQGQAYKVVVTDANGVQISSTDNVTDTTFFYIEHLKYISDSALLSFRHTATGALQRSVRSKLTDSLSVKDFGAVGDCVADDTAAFQLALNSLPAGGGRLIVPQGCYAISAEILAPKQTILEGDGSAASIIHASGQGYNLLRGQNNLTVRNIGFTRAEIAATTSYKAIHLDYAAFGGGVANTRVLVENVAITGFDIGVYASGSISVPLESVEVRNTKIIINTLGTGGGGSVRPTVNVLSAQRALIDNCDLDAGQAGSVNNVYLLGIEQVIVRHNRITRGDAVKVVTNSAYRGRRVSILENVFYVADLSILLETDTTPFDAVEITGNTFSNSKCTDPSVGDVTLANIVGMLNPAYGLVTFTNNTWVSAVGRPIYLGMGTGNTLSTLVMHGNKYYGFSTGTPGTYNVMSSSSSGTYTNFLAFGDVVDGQSTGRGYADIGNFAYINVTAVIEANVTSATNLITKVISAGTNFSINTPTPKTPYTYTPPGSNQGIVYSMTNGPFGIGQGNDKNTTVLSHSYLSGDYNYAQSAASLGFQEEANLLMTGYHPRLILTQPGKLFLTSTDTWTDNNIPGFQHVGGLSPATDQGGSLGSSTYRYYDLHVANHGMFYGDVQIPALKAVSGTRYICINTTGQLVSQTVACSGT